MIWPEDDERECPVSGARYPVLVVQCSLPGACHINRLAAVLAVVPRLES